MGEVGFRHGVSLALQTSCASQYDLCLAACLVAAQVGYVEADTCQLAAILIGWCQHFGLANELQVGLVVGLYEGHLAVVHNHWHCVAINHERPVAIFASSLVEQSAAEWAQIVGAV